MTVSSALQSHLDQGSQWLERLLDLSGFQASVQADIVEPLSHEHVEGQAVEEAVAWLTIDGSQLSPEEVALLIGEQGEVLDAIQYLASLELNFKADRETQRAFVVDIDGYRDRRREELKQLVTEAAATVQQSGQEQEICGLSSAERREVHTLLKAMFPLMETFSRGKEPDRRLVVQPRAPGEPES
ncbi:MAG: RNA-binding protein [Synechococcales cyanobacterium RM1_1_8]|nr:RNA-binding protein [Synechococcales cyanobacterium RM1_1_8]